MEVMKVEGIRMRAS